MIVKDLSTELEKLDQEWVDLILAAIDMGISVQEIQAFLHQQKS